VIAETPGERPTHLLRRRPANIRAISDVTHIRKRSLSRWRTIQQYRQLAFRALAAERRSRPPFAGAGAWLATTFHLRNGTDQLLDPEGIDLPNLGAVRTQALRNARDTLSNELRDGRLDLRYWIDVEDTDGRAVFSLLLGNAFETIRA